jgi:hypothetical protein
MRSILKGTAAVVLLLGTTACLDLNVINENNPDIDRALDDPMDVEQVIASAFPIYMHTFNSSDFSRPYPQLADEYTTTITTRSVHWAQEPREPLNNDPQASQVWIPRRPWDNFSECVANANDGLRQIDKGMRIITLDPGQMETVDNTDRAYFFAKLMQGWCLGYLGLTMDKVAIATEDTDLPLGYDDLKQWEIDNMVPYDSIMRAGLNSLEEAIRLAEAAEPFALPPTWINQKQYNNAEMIEFAHTLIARLLVLTPRTVQERDAVDWDKVLYHTERGLTYDFGPTLESGQLTQGNWLGLVTATSSEFRMDNLFIGQADQSGNFKNWLDTPFDERTAFFVVTPDRRVTGVPLTTCTEPDPALWTVGTGVASSRGDRCSPNGAYFRNRNTLGNFSLARSSGYHALYQWWRRSNYGGFISSTGHYTIASEDENRLFRAEALIRKGRVAEAIPLINVSRTRGQQIGNTVIASNLPPIPVTNDINTKVPTVNYTVVGRVYPSCVPRSHQDPTQCGNIWDALIWERKLETTGQDALRMWADFRGLGMLQPGTLIHWPVPGRYLVSLGLPIYTHGGVGGTGAAP